MRPGTGTRLDMVKWLEFENVLIIDYLYTVPGPSASYQHHSSHAQGLAAGERHMHVSCACTLRGSHAESMACATAAASGPVMTLCRCSIAPASSALSHLT